ncbi:hypothetical protein AAMO2058_000572300 [Amorphochlora amoebiformis]
MVETLALFSDNETLRDISSVNLKYLMCDYMYGYLFLNLHDQNHREICIREGLGAVRKFLSRVEDLELMSEQDKALYKRSGQPGPIVSARMEKISRLKQNRKMKSDLDELLKLEKQRAENEGVIDDDDREEDENERKKWILMIKLAVSDSLDHLRFAADELKMLEFRRKREADMKKGGGGGSRSAEGGNILKELKYQSNQKKPPSILHIKNAQDFMHQTGIIPRLGSGGAPNISKGMQTLNLAPKSHVQRIATTVTGQEDVRSRVMNEMFVPRNLPTMTMDELIDLEIKQGKIPVPKGPQRKKKPHELKREEENKPGSEEHSDVEDDEEHNKKQKKKRDWDNWKDDHEKGAGNRLSNPRGRNFI